MIDENYEPFNIKGKLLESKQQLKNKRIKYLFR